MSGLTLQSALSFAAASLLIEMTPGPNMTWLAVISATKGKRAGLAAVAGVAAGLGLIGVLAALGVAELVRATPAIYEALRWAGIGFMLYLAAEGWFDGGGDPAEGDGAGGYFLRGFVTNVLNPKAAVFYVAMLPAFLSQSGAVLTQTLQLTAIYVAIATAVHVFIALAAARLKPFFNDPVRQTRMRRTLSALLALVAVWFAWATAR